MIMKEGSKPTAADLDKRVRDRNLLSGRLDAKTVERHLAELVDVEAQCDTLLVPQPAVGDAEDDGDEA